MIILVDIWMCTQCHYTEIRDPPERDGTDHTACTANPFADTPKCPDCKRAFSSRFGAYAQPMEPCLYVVLFGEQGYLNRCATSRMPAIHEKIGYQPLPDKATSILNDYIIFPDDVLGYHNEKRPYCFLTSS